jgi:hypothetical protein
VRTIGAVTALYVPEASDRRTHAAIVAVPSPSPACLRREYQWRLRTRGRCRVHDSVQEMSGQSSKSSDWTGEVLMKRLVTALLLLAGMYGSVATADAGTAPPQWAPAGQATIHPGVQTTYGGRTCTANFVFYDSRAVYLGVAASCFTSATLIQGCSIPTRRLGAKVTVEGASRPATLVYNSHLTMQQRGERRVEVCDGNDFALIRLHPTDTRKVNPSVPSWGGPSSVATGHTTTGERTYGAISSHVLGSAPRLQPTVGVNTTDVHVGIGGALGWGPEPSDWTHHIELLNPAPYGSSGGAFLDAEGRPLGVQTTWSLDGTVGVIDLGQALRYMKATTNLKAVTLAQGTAPFVTQAP